MNNFSESGHHLFRGSSALERGNLENCLYISVVTTAQPNWFFAQSFPSVAHYARRFPRGRWSILGPGSEKKWHGTYSDEPDGAWDKTAEQRMMNFAETSRPIFRASSALERGELRSKEKGKKSVHFTGSEENIELFLQISSVSTEQ